MTDLHDRFATLDGLSAPSLWTAIEVRSVSVRRGTGTLVLLVATLGILLAGIVVGAVSFGSRGLLASPSATPIPTKTAAPVALSPLHCAWRTTGSMLQAQHASTVTLLLDGRVLVAGGRVGSDAIAFAELYDPTTEAWTATRPMPAARAYATAALLRDGRVLVFGGTDASESATEPEIASAVLYDPGTETWAATGSLAEARQGAATAVLPDGRVLAAGGWGSTDRFGPKLATAEIYDSHTGAWSTTASMTVRRHGASAILLRSGRVLVAGGYDSGRLLQAELFDPALETWAATGDLPEPFLGYAAGLLADGRVLIAGGDVPQGPGAVASNHAALFDPVGGSWTLAAPMGQARLGPSGAVLGDGRFFVTGGVPNGASGGEAFVSTELFDPSTGAWTFSHPMSIGHDLASLLRDGRMLAAGGTSSSGETLTSAELCVPA
jgi:hypothetical protein